MWTRVDQFIKGTYLGASYAGIVVESRVRYGGSVRHTVELVEPIVVFGEDRYRLLIDEEDQFTVDIDDVFAY